MKKTFRQIEPYFYLIPALAIFALFVFWPFIKTIMLSLARTTPAGEIAEFIGLQNYKTIFSDSSFWRTLMISFAYSAMCVVFSICIGFVLAVASNEKLKGRGLFAPFMRCQWRFPLRQPASSGCLCFTPVWVSSTAYWVPTLAG